MSVSTAFRWLGGPLVWAAHFSVLYGAQFLVCTRAGEGAYAVLAAAATAGALGVLAFLTIGDLRRARRTARPVITFTEGAAAILAIAGMAAVLATAVPLVLIPMCAPIA